MSIPHRNSRPANVAASERTFFISASTWEKRNLLQSNRAAELLIRTLQDYRAQRRFLLHEFVVMPNHVHLLIPVDIDMTIEKAVQLIKGGFSFQAGKVLGIAAPFWQRGFSEVRVLDSNSFGSHRRYIHNNPVEAHLVGRPEEYPYSSAKLTSDLDRMPDRLKPAFSAEFYAVG